MKHLSWWEIMEGLERGDRPSHLDACQECEARWEKAKGMLLALRPEEEACRDIEALTQRILLQPQGRRRRWVPGLRWAWAAGIVLCLCGSLVFWHYRQSDLERQYAAILAGDVHAYPAGLDNLLPGEFMASPDQGMNVPSNVADDEKGE